jgi:hypothetical protein
VVRWTSGVIATLCCFALTTTLVWGANMASRSPRTWRGDYETRNFGQWSEVQASRDNGDYSVSEVGDTEAKVIRSPVRQGAAAAKFVTYPSTSAPNGDRAEVDTSVANTGGFEGVNRYYAWSTMFPRSGNPKGFWSHAGDFNVFTQWHNEESACGNNLQLGIDATRGQNRVYSDLSIRAPGDCDNQLGTRHSILGTLRYDTWYDFIVHVKWSSRRQTGSYEIWMNGRQVLRKKLGATMWNSSGTYWKQGFYRAAFNAVNTVYQDGAIAANNLRTVTQNFRLRLTGKPEVQPDGRVSVETRSFSRAPVEIVLRNGSTVIGRARGQADGNGVVHADVALTGLPAGLPAGSQLRAYLRAEVSSKLPRSTRQAVVAFPLARG